MGVRVAFRGARCGGDTIQRSVKIEVAPKRHSATLSDLSMTVDSENDSLRGAVSRRSGRLACFGERA